MTCLVTLLSLILAHTARGRKAQISTPTTSDSQAAAVLTLAVTTVEGPQALTSPPVQDFTATGTITYYWAGEPVQGPATVRGRGVDQFRLDANLPAGVRSYSVSHGTGALQDTDGSITPIPYHNTINTGILTFPFPGIAARLSDPLAVLTDMGLVATASGAQLHQVRVQRQFATQADPGGSLSSLCITDYFLDPQTNLLLQVIDTTHPVETMTQRYSHEVDLGNYTTVNGILVPMLISEKVGGQTIWQLQLSGMVFNTGLTDLVFTLQ